MREHSGFHVQPQNIWRGRDRVSAKPSQRAFATDYRGTHELQRLLVVLEKRH